LSSINPKTNIVVKDNRKLRFNLKNNKYYEVENNENYFKENEKVLYRNHFKDYCKWLPAKIVKRYSKYLFVIYLKGGTRVAHKNQLRYPRNMDKDYFCNKVPKFNELGNKEKIKENVVRRSEREKKVTKR